VTAYLATLALAIGLALDTAVVAAARAAGGRSGLALPWLFGVAHAGMAAAGWMLGRQAVDALSTWDHWIAFVVLVVLGVRMVVAPLRPTAAAPPAEGPWELVVLALATSIDALAAGLAIDVLGVAPVIAIALIGGVCVVLSTCASLLGRWAARIAGGQLSRVGGLVLIAVAIRIVVLHTS
jgi:putative Mn2+ efflux pump MntP